MSSETRRRPRPSSRPRYRYVLFRLTTPSPVARDDLIQRIRRAAPPDRAEGYWLTRYDGHVGILRCPRGQETDAAELLRTGLRKEGLEAETLSTSGTIAGLERRHGRLERPQPRPR